MQKMPVFLREDQTEKLTMCASLTNLLFSVPQVTIQGGWYFTKPHKYSQD